VVVGDQRDIVRGRIRGHRRGVENVGAARSHVGRAQGVADRHVVGDDDGGRMA
jgi:hypothetical protein